MQKHNDYVKLLKANINKKFIQRTINPDGKRLGGNKSVVTRQIDDIVFPTVQEFKTRPLIRLKTGVKTRLRQLGDQSAMDRAIKNNNYVRVPKQFMKKRMDFGRWLSNSSYVENLRNKK